MLFLLRLAVCLPLFVDGAAPAARRLSRSRLLRTAPWAVGIALAPPADASTFRFDEAALGLELRDDGGDVVVSTVRPGTAAAKSEPPAAYDRANDGANVDGVTPNNILTQIDGRSVRGQTADQVVKSLRASPRPVVLELELDVERAARAQGLATAKVTISPLSPPPGGASMCMRSQASDVVEIDYVGRLSDGTVFDSRDRFALLLGNGEVVKGLELGLFEMCIGERRIITVPAALGFGDRGSKTFRVPPGAALEYEVQMRGINLQVDPAVKRADLDAEQRFK